MQNLDQNCYQQKWISSEDQHDIQNYKKLKITKL